MCTIQDHTLQNVAFLQAADHGSRFRRPPRFIIIHYTAGASMTGAVTTLTTKDNNYVSAHVCVDKDGTLAQLVRFDTIAYHAGKSSWKGVNGLNSCAIGIELVNPGYVAGHAIAGWPTQPARHKNGGPLREWYEYPKAQVVKLVEVLRALCHTYAIEDIVGHDDVAVPKGRKTDPGPLLDVHQLTQLVFIDAKGETT